MRSASARLTQLVTLVAVFGLLWLATLVVPGSADTSALVGALGFLLLAGNLTSELCVGAGQRSSRRPV